MIASYAGVPLLHATPEVRKVVEQQLRPEHIFHDLSERGRRTSAWTFVNHTIHSRPIVLDSVYMPMGACRWGRAHFVCTGEDLKKIEATAISGGQPQKCELKIGDGKTTLTFYMSMLPPIPIWQFGVPKENLYLLTLVDDRYYWWFAESDDIVISPTCDKTWTELLSDIFTAMGVSYVLDTPATEYLRPCHVLTSHWEFLPQLLESVAYNIGRRVHIDSESTSIAYVKSPDSALTLNDALLNQGLVPIVGPEMFDLATAEYSCVLPKQVRVVYPKQLVTEDVWPCTYDIKSINLTALTDAELVARLPGVVGFNQAKVFQDTCLWKTGGAGNNDTEMDDLTEQIATDYYKWQMGRVHGVFSGFHQINPHGLIDSIEWIDTGEESKLLEDPEHENLNEAETLFESSRSGLFTIVRRPPFNDLTHELLHCGTYDCDPECKHYIPECLKFDAEAVLALCGDPSLTQGCLLIGVEAELLLCGDGCSCKASCLVIETEAELLLCGEGCGCKAPCLIIETEAELLLCGDGCGCRTSCILIDTPTSLEACIGEILALTVKEADGSPSYTLIHTIQFDQADGFVVTQPSAGIAKIDLSGVATTTQIPIDIGAKVYLDALQTITAGATTAISFANEDWDTHAFWAGGAPTKFTFQAAGNGKYLVCFAGLCVVAVTDDTSELCIATIHLNGSASAVRGSQVGSGVFKVDDAGDTVAPEVTVGQVYLNGSVLINITNYASDYIELHFTAGGSFDMEVYESSMSIQKINAAGTTGI